MPDLAPAGGGLKATLNGKIAGIPTYQVLGIGVLALAFILYRRHKASVAAAATAGPSLSGPSGVGVNPSYSNPYALSGIPGVGQSPSYPNANPFYNPTDGGGPLWAPQYPPGSIPVSNGNSPGSTAVSAPAPQAPSPAGFNPGSGNLVGSGYFSGPVVTTPTGTYEYVSTNAQSQAILAGGGILDFQPVLGLFEPMTANLQGGTPLYTKVQ